MKSSSAGEADMCAPPTLACSGTWQRGAIEGGANAVQRGEIYSRHVLPSTLGNVSFCRPVRHAHRCFAGCR